MIELLSYEFMQRAIVAGVFVAILCALVGMFVVLRGISFMGAGIAHSAFGGVALGIFLGVNPIMVAFLFSICIALLIGVVSRGGRISEDSAIGIAFPISMAFGVVLIGLTKGYTMNLFGYLFGNILTVTSSDLSYIILLGAFVLACVVVFYRQLIYICFDEESAKASGIKTERLHYLLLILISITVVGAMKVVGIVLVSALLIIPAAASLQLFRNLTLCILTSLLIGVGAVICGIMTSYYLNIATGGTIVLVCGLVFTILFVYNKVRA